MLLTACSASAGASREEERATTSVVSSRTTTVGPEALCIGQKAETKEGNVVQLLAYQRSVPPVVVEPEPGTEFAVTEAEKDRRRQKRLNAASEALTSALALKS